MASFLDKAGLTKFWENVNGYLNSNFAKKNEIYTLINPFLDLETSDIYSNSNHIPITILDNTFRYNDSIKGYTDGYNNSNAAYRILLKFYNKTLLLKDINKRNNSIIKVKEVVLSILNGTTKRYLGRLPINEIYYEFSYKIYGEVSFDIYLKRFSKFDPEQGNIYKYYLELIPVLISNSYTINFIPGEQMIRYLHNNPKLMSSYNFYKVDLVTDSPFDFISFDDISMNNNTIDVNRLVGLCNRSDIEYTIRYPRYLNGILTFLKVNINAPYKVELADKTPNVVDGTYNEVTLTKDTKLCMYGNIYINKLEFPIEEEIKFDISTTAQDTKDKLLTLEGDISTIGGLLKTYHISSDYISNIGVLTTLNNFKLFQSQYIGNITIHKPSYYNLPFDPILSLQLYRGLFSNTGITRALAGIHIMGNHPYKVTNRYDSLIGIFNNFTEAYRNCKQLTSLRIYIYLEGDIDLDSTLKDDQINYFWLSLRNMVEGSDNLNEVILSPGVKGSLGTEDFEKFEKLIKPIADKIKQERPNWEVSIIDSDIPM
jgi:hypothetical protein